jgi:hypothetical protein
MWHAPGNKKLVIQGKFKELFLEGVSAALEGWFTNGDAALDGDDWGLTYVKYSEPYANLSNKEKLWALAEVTRCLTTNCKPPKLLQWNESAVYAVFETIASEIIVEIDNNAMGVHDPDFRSWRKLASEAQRELRDYEDDEHYIDPESDDAYKWQSVVINNLAELILWDDDFLESSARIICDKSPERAERVKYMAGISKDYYSTPIPIVTEEMLKKAKKFLRKM